MDSVATLRDEHEGVLTVLDQLGRATAAAARGAAVPKDVFSDIQEFFAVFVDKCHHGKEEAQLFPLLVGGPATPLVRRLEDEHVVGRDLARAYADAVQAYEPGNAEFGAKLQRAADAYTAFLREHIALETDELFPAMIDALATRDEELNEAFERMEVDVIGAGTHERLHGMIEGLPKRINPWLK
jgi:hemerythrin-like domain-containing protein